MPLSSTLVRMGLALLAGAVLVWPGFGVRAAPVAFSADLVEVRPAAGDTRFVIESTTEIGSGTELFALKVDGGSDRRIAFDDAQLQGLWMPRVADGMLAALGVRHDLRSGPDLSHGVAGLEVWFQPWLYGEAYAYLSEHGDMTGSAKLLARAHLAPGTVLEPRVQFGWSAQAIAEESLAEGLTDLEASLRLRRVLSANLDAYVGVAHELQLGATADLVRAAGDAVSATYFVIGAGLSF